MRTIIEVPEALLQRLDQLGMREKKSRAAIIREAIKIYLERKDAGQAEAAFGIWQRKGKGKEGLAYQENLRSEWS